MHGSVYIATNEYLPDLVKIGRSKDPAQRMIALSQASGVPGSFVLAHAVEVADMREVEARMHERFAARRVEGSEFFRVGVGEARAALDRMAAWPWPLRRVFGTPSTARRATPWPLRAARALLRMPGARPRCTVAAVFFVGLFVALDAADVAVRQAGGLAFLATCAFALALRTAPRRARGRRKRAAGRARRWSAAEMISLLVGVTIALGLLVQRHGSV